MSLKDALLKAGFSSNKKENDRVPKLKKERTKIQKHQFQRNFCEICEAHQPDVERFKHKKPTVDAEWICLNCADKNEIHDQFRLTQQSDVAKNKMYRRYYGPTKDFNKEGIPEKSTQRSGGGNRNANRNHGKRENRPAKSNKNFNK